MPKSLTGFVISRPPTPAVAVIFTVTAATSVRGAASEDPGAMGSLVFRPNFAFAAALLAAALYAHNWPGNVRELKNTIDRAVIMADGDEIAPRDLPDEITAGTGTVGVRLPNDEVVRRLVRECGGVLTATSANPAGRSPARSADEVRTYFPEGLDLILDGGEVTVTEPSTVLDAITSPPRIVREGAIRAADLIARA